MLVGSSWRYPIFSTRRTMSDFLGRLRGASRGKPWHSRANCRALSRGTSTVPLRRGGSLFPISFTPDRDPLWAFGGDEPIPTEKSGFPKRDGSSHDHRRFPHLQYRPRFFGLERIADLVSTPRKSDRSTWSTEAGVRAHVGLGWSLGAPPRYGASPSRTGRRNRAPIRGGVLRPNSAPMPFDTYLPLPRVGRAMSRTPVRRGASSRTRWGTMLVLVIAVGMVLPSASFAGLIPAAPHGPGRSSGL